ncbi:glycosyltransferase [Sphingobacterium faecium]|uniref:glycosyltransferase n=1 Tax=Sphingobacterium faecium TaxID=34087 RepID=UPI0032096FFA
MEQPILKNKKKALLISYPLFSHNFAMKPYIKALLDENFQIDYLNTDDYVDFIKHENFKFYPYESYKGLETDTLDNKFSIFKLGLSIHDAYASTVSQIEKHILKTCPDLIIHPKFGFAAKLSALRYNIPTINMTSGFVFNPDIVFKFYKQSNDKGIFSGDNIYDGKTLIRKYEKTLQEYDLLCTDCSDLYVNKGSLNVVMNIPEFQPNLKDFLIDFEFLGMNFEEYGDHKKEDLIYVSLGTVFNKESNLFNKFIDYLSPLNVKVVLDAKTKYEKLPDGFQLAKLGKQKEYLQRAKLFITHGGACSIHESLFYKTPMIVIPQTAEHEINGDHVVQNNFGLKLLTTELNGALLRKYISQVYDAPDKIDSLNEWSKKYDLIHNKSVFIRHVYSLLNI